MALNCINLHQKRSKGFGGRGAAPDPTGGLGGPLDPRPESMAKNIFATTTLIILVYVAYYKFNFQTVTFGDILNMSCIPC